MLQIVTGLLLFYHISTAIASQQTVGSQHKQLPAAISSFCLDSTVESFINNSTSASSHIWAPCAWKSDDVQFKDRLYTSLLTTTTTTDNDNKSSVAVDEQQQQTSAPMNITFHCNLASKDTCTKAQKAFQKAGDIISSVILFREPVNVNATLVSFCGMGGQCHREEDIVKGKGLMTLGGSSPARAMPLLNTDGLLRLHPQALVKQFGVDEHPAFSPYDIQSVFNADAPFWFEEDGVPIASHQADFLFVILHEFMHGLGFYSSWNEYISVQALTPDPSPFIANQFMTMLNPGTSALHPSQFLESAMDRLMKVVTPAGEGGQEEEQKPISDITRRLNKIQARTVKDLVSSPEFEKAAKQMNVYATTPGSLELDLEMALAAAAASSSSSSVGASNNNTNAAVDNEALVLETSLKPFQPGSSISHVDYKKYTHSPDFLMRFMQDRGFTLTDAMKRGGGDHPIGPLLLSVLEAMGYSTIRNPDVIPPLMAFHEQGMTGLIIDQFDDLDNSSGSGSGMTSGGNGALRRKHPHHDNLTNMTDSNRRHLSSASRSSLTFRDAFNSIVVISVLFLLVL